MTTGSSAANAGPVASFLALVFCEVTSSLVVGAGKQIQLIL